MTLQPFLAPAFAVVVLAGSIAAVFGNTRVTSRPNDTLTPMSTAQELSSLRTAKAWLNSEPLTAGRLRGKVVLIDFWTYTCINWIRTLPYVRAWAEKYREHGLVVVGVHTPEFGFEHDLEQVRRAVLELRVAYPVAIDNDYTIWRAFANNYWPALYLVDADGRMRYSHFGEGDYERSERAIRELLAEAGARDLDPTLVSARGDGVEAAADWPSLRSPETYVGHARTERFASPGGVVPNQRRAFMAPARLERNQWALSGEWTFGSQATTLHQAGGRIVYRFHARDLHLVMAPGSGGSIRFRVLIDGQPSGAAHGVDVDAQGFGTVSAPRMYQLIRQPKPIGDRTFTIEFEAPGVEVYAFTFG
jgi:thiol-disulfide isomerase/thioredoxin